MAVGTIGSLGNGATLPLMLIVFMNIFDAFTDSVKFCESTTSNASNITTSTVNYASLQLLDKKL